MDAGTSCEALRPDRRPLGTQRRQEIATGRGWIIGADDRRDHSDAIGTGAEYLIEVRLLHPPDGQDGRSHRGSDGPQGVEPHRLTVWSLRGGEEDGAEDQKV